MKTQYIDVEVGISTARKRVEVIQNDTGRILRCRIVDMSIPEGATATLYTDKQHCKECSVNGNIVETELTTQILADTGVTSCQIQINNSGKSITTFDIDIDVKRSMRDNGGIESTNEFGVLEEALHKVEELQATGLKGDPGIQGIQGPVGKAATISVGKVETGAPGSRVEVKNTGTESQAVIDFKIPKGESGTGSGDVTTEQLNAVLGYKVDKVSGMGLSERSYTAAEKDKLSGIAQNANNFTYTHPSTAGNKHIPAGGKAGQYLGYLSDGQAQWKDIAIPEPSKQETRLIRVPKAILTQNCSYTDGIVTAMFTVNLPSSLGLGKNSAKADWRKELIVTRYALNFGIENQYNQEQRLIDTKGITSYGSEITSGCEINAKMDKTGMLEISLSVGSSMDSDCSNYKTNVDELLIVVSKQSDMLPVTGNNNGYT